MKRAPPKTLFDVDFWHLVDHLVVYDVSVSFLPSQEVHQSPFQSQKSSLWWFSVDECRGRRSIIMHEMDSNLFWRKNHRHAHNFNWSDDNSCRREREEGRDPMARGRTHDQLERKSTFSLSALHGTTRTRWRLWGSPLFLKELSSRSARSRCLAFRGPGRLTRFSLHEPGRTNRLTNPTLLVCICSSFPKYFQSTPSHRDSTPTPEMSCLHTVFPSSDTSRRFIMHPATNCPFPLDILPFVVLLLNTASHALRTPTFDQHVWLTKCCWTWTRLGSFGWNMILNRHWQNSLLTSSSSTSSTDGPTPHIHPSRSSLHWFITPADLVVVRTTTPRKRMIPIRGKQKLLEYSVTKDKIKRSDVVDGAQWNLRVLNCEIVCEECRVTYVFARTYCKEVVRPNWINFRIFATCRLTSSVERHFRPHWSALWRRCPDIFVQSFLRRESLREGREKSIRDMRKHHFQIRLYLFISWHRDQRRSSSSAR